MPPTLANGKICYVEIPAIDMARSAEFYTSVFGWQTRRRGDGQTAFDDGAGEVSGTWVTGRPASGTPGLMLYIMVDSVARTIDDVIATRRRTGAAHRGGCARDNRSISRSGRQRDRTLSRPGS